MLSKEQGLTVLGVCMVVDVCICVVRTVELSNKTDEKGGRDIAGKGKAQGGVRIGEWRCWHILAPATTNRGGWV